jgi:hypothetical protein
MMYRHITDVKPAAISGPGKNPVDPVGSMSSQAQSNLATALTGLVEGGISGDIPGGIAAGFAFSAASPVSAGAGIATGLAAGGAGKLVDMCASATIERHLKNPPPEITGAGRPEEIRGWSARMFWLDMLLQKTMKDAVESVPRMKELMGWHGSKTVYKELSFGTRTALEKELAPVMDNLATAYEVQRLALTCEALAGVIGDYLTAHSTLTRQWHLWDEFLTPALTNAARVTMAKPAAHRTCNPLYCYNA